MNPFILTAISAAQTLGDNTATPPHSIATERVTQVEIERSVILEPFAF